MGDFALRVEGLSKSFRLGRTHGPGGVADFLEVAIRIGRHTVGASDGARRREMHVAEIGCFARTRGRLRHMQTRPALHVPPVIRPTIRQFTSGGRRMLHSLTTGRIIRCIHSN